MHLVLRIHTKFIIVFFFGELVKDLVCSPMFGLKAGFTSNGLSLLVGGLLI